jgi:hypothetical protein
MPNFEIWKMVFHENWSKSASHVAVHWGHSNALVGNKYRKRGWGALLCQDEHATKKISCALVHCAESKLAFGVDQQANGRFNDFRSRKLGLRNDRRR